MKKLLILTVTLLVLSAGYIAQPESALACSCERELPGTSVEQQVRSAVDRVDVVFAGRVEQVEIQTVERGGRTYRELLAHFTVTDTWKGEIGESVVVNGGPMECCVCGYTFVAGYNYLVYAYKDPSTGMLFTSICTRTDHLADAATDIALVSKYVESNAQVGMPVVGESSPHLLLIGLVALATLCLGAIIRSHKAS